MIHGIGCDLAAVARFAAAAQRHGQAFAQRILHPSEWEAFTRLPPAQQAPWLAKRWAAKEAFGKALGTGVRAPFTLSALAIGHDAQGRPEFALSAALQDELARHGVGRVHLSLSDEADYVLAYVVMESRHD